MSTKAPINTDPTVRQASRLLGISDTKVRQLISEGLLAAYPELGEAGGKTRVSKQGIVKYMKAAQKARQAAERAQARRLQTLEAESEAA